jgi:hypothetical protein
LCVDRSNLLRHEKLLAADMKTLAEQDKVVATMVSKAKVALITFAITASDSHRHF